MHSTLSTRCIASIKLSTSQDCQQNENIFASALFCCEMSLFKIIHNKSNYLGWTSFTSRDSL